MAERVVKVKDMVRSDWLEFVREGANHTRMEATMYLLFLEERRSFE